MEPVFFCYEAGLSDHQLLTHCVPAPAMMTNPVFRFSSLQWSFKGVCPRGLGPIWTANMNSRMWRESPEKFQEHSSGSQKLKLTLAKWWGKNFNFPLFGSKLHELKHNYPTSYINNMLIVVAYDLYAGCLTGHYYYTQLLTLGKPTAIKV